MRRVIFALLISLSSTGIGAAADVSATLVPDGFYSVTVEQVKTPKTMSVTMQNGLHVDVHAAAHTNVSFDKVPKNGHIKIQIIEGQVVGVVKI